MGTLIFDLDGTLSDPAVGIGRSLNYALAAFGYRPVSDAEVATLVGPPLDWAFRQIVPGIADDTVVALIAKYRERYAEVGYSENVLYDGIAEALGQLTADGVRMGVCTSKRVDFAQRILEMFGLSRHFGFVSGGDIGITKEDQLRTLVRAGTVATDDIMIGDRAVDIEAARANGLGAVGVLWGYGSEAELRSAAPDRIIAVPEDLRGLTKGRNGGNGGKGWRGGKGGTGRDARCEIERSRYENRKRGPRGRMRQTLDVRHWTFDLRPDRQRGYRSLMRRHEPASGGWRRV